MYYIVVNGYVNNKIKDFGEFFFMFQTYLNVLRCNLKFG